MAEAEGSDQTTIAEESARVYFSRCRSAVLLRRVNDERRPLQHGYPQVPQGCRGDLATRDRDGGARCARQGTARRERFAQAGGHLVDPRVGGQARRRGGYGDDVASTPSAPKKQKTLPK